MKKSKKMSRRELLRHSITTSIACSISTPSKTFAQPPGAYEGKCVVSVMLDGGADPTQFCDPKTNTPGERKINNWADNDEPRQIGNITFAPIADNEWLLSRFGADMLVINGVDYRTNSHTNVNEAVRAHVAMTSLNAETDDGARSAIRQQIATLFRNATSEELSDAQIDELAAALSAYAQRELVREVPGYNGLTWNSGKNWYVDWGLFSIGGKVRKENPTLHHARYNDPRAMVRAWTMLTHQVMQSFGIRLSVSPPLSLLPSQGSTHSVMDRRMTPEPA